VLPKHKPGTYLVLDVVDRPDVNYVFLFVQGLSDRVFCPRQSLRDPERNVPRDVEIGDFVRVNSTDRGLKAAELVYSVTMGKPQVNLPELPDDCGLIPVEAFFAAHQEYELFGPEEGEGLYATDYGVSPVEVKIGDDVKGMVPLWATHVAWFTALYDNL
jgi:hypothetical protein